MSIAATAIIFLIALLMQALFAGYETGFVSSNTLRVRHMAQEEGVPRAVRLLHYLARPDQMLAMLLVGTNIATVAGTVAVATQFKDLATSLLGEDDARRWGELAAAISTTPILLVFGEIIPKSVFRAHPTRLALALLPVIRVFYVALAPVTAPMAWLTRLFFRVKGDQQHHISPLMSTREDVCSLVDESADHGNIQPEERRMIHSVINLQSRQAKEVMVPRIDIQALPETATREELFAMFEKSGLTRIPIYRETIDRIIGVVIAHDLLLDTHTGDQSIVHLIHEVPHVPDTMKLHDLFEMLKSTRQHMAIVTDEYGGTDGLVSIEDILEQIFGDIQDEHDPEETLIQRVGPDAYLIDARMSLEDAAQAIGVRIMDEEVETVGGWLMHVAGRIPSQGEVVTHDGFKITVLEGGVNHIAKIRLEVLSETRTKEPDVKRPS